jgi:hypothetical protein
MKYTRHPVFRMLTPQEAADMGRVEFERLYQEREKRMYWAEQDPLGFGWEPEVYLVADALLDFNWFVYGSGAWEEKRDLNRAIREVLGFSQPVTALLIQGGNQIGKTEYAIKRLVMLGLAEKKDFWAFHSSEDMSKQSHQAGMWRYLPAELKTENGIKTGKEYIVFKQKTGFSENGFILPNLSRYTFKTYGMEQDKAIQGPNVFGVWGDELIPLSWAKDLMYRVAKQGGFCLFTFTPKNGYSPMCAWFYEGAEVVRESVAFMLPKDGKERDVVRALGFEDRQGYVIAYEQGEDAKGQKGYGPNSVPERCLEWLKGGRGQPEVPEGRMFRMMPRVMRCAPILFDGKWVHNRAVLFFHSNDGPYGNPRNILQSAVTQSEKEIMWRVYGYATKLATAMIGNFAEHHICRASAIPEKGTNYHFMDPAAARNPFQTWIRFCGEDIYVYREWPGNYEIPGEGVPGEWVLPDEKHPDGVKGPGQDSFNWGLKRHKAEFARLEGWADYKEGLEKVEDWSEENGAREVMDLRFMDGRAASAPKLENDRPVTLLTMFEDIGVTFHPTPADDVDSGAEALRDLLDWEPGEQIMGKYRLHICEDCVNTITALRMWTNKEGQKGAAKDPVDNLRYMATLNLCDTGGGGMMTTLRDFG